MGTPAKHQTLFPFSKNCKRDFFKQRYVNFHKKTTRFFQDVYFGGSPMVACTLPA